MDRGIIVKKGNYYIFTYHIYHHDITPSESFTLQYTEFGVQNNKPFQLYSNKSTHASLYFLYAAHEEKWQYNQLLFTGELQPKTEPVIVKEPVYVNVVHDNVNFKNVSVPIVMYILLFKYHEKYVRVVSVVHDIVIVCQFQATDMSEVVAHLYIAATDHEFHVETYKYHHNIIVLTFVIVASKVTILNDWYAVQLYVAVFILAADFDKKTDVEDFNQNKSFLSEYTE